MKIVWCAGAMWRAVGLTVGLTGVLAVAAAMGQAPPAENPPAKGPESAPGKATEQAPASADAPSAEPLQFDQLPPPVKLGVRVEFIKQNSPVAPVVVIVKDPNSYLAAIRAWKPTCRFPVLIDDGTGAAREDIARFFRGFRAQFDGAKLVTYAAADAGGNWRAVTELDLRSALADAFGASPGPALVRQEAVVDLQRRIPAPGIVVTHPEDMAWPAALALAAARGQVLHMAKVAGDPTTVMSVEDGDALEESIEAAAETTKIPWKGIGDGLEAVTLCLNCPVKVRTPEKDEAALTDRIGRLGKGTAAVTRWAWAGQIFGSPARATYMAMCGVFLTTRNSWIFDGYPNTKPWDTFDGQKAGEILKSAGWEVTLDDTPKQGLRDWRARVSKPVDAGLVLINSKGNSDFFELELGQAKPADLPVFVRPAAVHMVHSWSAQWPARRETVAGRWFERGVYAYAGSVKEPYLHAFVPTPVVATRFTLVAPWAAAVRLDDAPLWKIAVFGDPLMTSGMAFKTAAADAVLDAEKGVLKGATEVGGNLAELGRAGKYLEVVRGLTLLGRDEKVKDLIAALMRERPEQVTEEAAAEAILPMMRAGASAKEIFAVAAKLGPTVLKDPYVTGPVRDALWLIAAPSIERADEQTLQVLRQHVRVENAERDASELGRAWARRYSRAEALVVLKELKAGVGGVGGVGGVAMPAEAIDKAIASVNAVPNVR